MMKMFLFSSVLFLFYFIYLFIWVLRFQGGRMDDDFEGKGEKKSIIWMEEFEKLRGIGLHLENQNAC